MISNDKYERAMGILPDRRKQLHPVIDEGHCVNCDNSGVPDDLGQDTITVHPQPNIRDYYKLMGDTDGETE